MSRFCRRFRLEERGGFGFALEVVQFDLQFADAAGKFLEAAAGLDRPRDEPDGNPKRDAQNQEDRKYPFHSFVSSVDGVTSQRRSK